MVFVFDADYGTVLDHWVITDICLHVDGEYLVTVETDDDVLDPVFDVQEAVNVHIANVAAMDPDLAVGVLLHNIIGFRLIVEVSLHHGRSRDADLAFFAKAQFVCGTGSKDTYGGCQ